VPCQQGVQYHYPGKSIQRFTPLPLDFDRQSSAFAMIEPRFLAQQLFENTDFLLQIFDHVLLVAIQPASDTEHQKCKRIHRHKMAMLDSPAFIAIAKPIKNGGRGGRIRTSRHFANQRQLEQIIRQMQTLSRQIFFETVPGVVRRKRLGKNVLGFIQGPFGRFPLFTPSPFHRAFFRGAARPADSRRGFHCPLARRFAILFTVVVSRRRTAMAASSLSPLANPHN
jgi:hypothetical protein